MPVGKEFIAVAIEQPSSYQIGKLIIDNLNHKPPKIINAKQVTNKILPLFRFSNIFFI